MTDFHDYVRPRITQWSVAPSQDGTGYHATMTIRIGSKDIQVQDTITDIEMRTRFADVLPQAGKAKRR